MQRRECVIWTGIFYFAFLYCRLYRNGQFKYNFFECKGKQLMKQLLGFIFSCDQEKKSCLQLSCLGYFAVTNKNWKTLILIGWLDSENHHEKKNSHETLKEELLNLLMENGTVEELEFGMTSIINLRKAITIINCL